MKFFSKCEHKWKVLVEKTTESTFEHALRVTGNDVGVCIPFQLCQDGRKHIVILTCEKCGCLKETVNNL
jgi:hypothetical protein